MVRWFGVVWCVLGVVGAVGWCVPWCEKFSIFLKNEQINTHKNKNEKNQDMKNEKNEKKSTKKKTKMRKSRHEKNQHTQCHDPEPNPTDLLSR